MSARLQHRNSAASSVAGGLYCADCGGGPHKPGTLTQKRDGRFVCKRCDAKSKRQGDSKKVMRLFGDEDFGQSTSLFDRMENRLQGFLDPSGRFHPIRSSEDYNEFKAGDFEKARAPKRPKKRKYTRTQKKTRAARAKAKRAELKAKGVKPKSRRKPTEALTLSQFVRRSGGFTASGKYAGEARRLSKKESGSTGLVNKRAGWEGKGGLWRKATPEVAMDRANEAGYLDPKTGAPFDDIGRFLDAVESDTRGGRGVVHHPGYEYPEASRYLNPHAGKPVVIVGKFAVAHISQSRPGEALIGRLLSRDGKGYFPVGPRGQSFKTFKTLPGAKTWGRAIVKKFDASAEGRGKGWVLTKNPTQADRDAYSDYKRAAKAENVPAASFKVWYSVVTDPLTLGIGAADKDRFASYLVDYGKGRAAKARKNPGKVKISPEVARRLLASYVGPDTPLRWAVIGKMARKMREGSFVPKSPLGLTADGRLHDGRHRLEAVIQSGKTISFEVARKNPGRFVGAFRHAVAKHRVSGARQALTAKLKSLRAQIEELERDIIEYRHDPLWRDVKHAKKWAAEGSLRKQKLQKLETQLRRELEALPVINPARAQKIDPSLAARHEMFQGRPATKVTEALTAIENPAKGWKLGDLVYVDVKTAKGVVRIEGARGAGGPMLNASKGNKLYISGLQHEKPDGLEAGKRRTYGEIVEIAYLTPKAHINNGRVTEYWHPMGEETGERPRYAVNSYGWPLIVGGAYSIDERGIIN